jgi:hypothetical protein
VTAAGGPSDRLLAIEELRSLSTEYGAAADGRDGDRFAQLFVADGELVVPNFPEDLRPVITRSGHDSLRRVPDRLRVYDRTFHQMSNHRYVVEGTTATGTVLCMAHHASAAEGPGGGGGTDTVWFIRYHDTYRSTDSGWRFARRELHLQWVEERTIASPGILPPGDAPAD